MGIGDGLFVVLSCSQGAQLLLARAREQESLLFLHNEALRTQQRRNKCSLHRRACNSQPNRNCLLLAAPLDAAEIAAREQSRMTSIGCMGW